MENVIILGAGLSGLGCAGSLPQARIFEALPHPGGHAYSHPVGGVFFDEGAHISHSKDKDFVDLICNRAKKVEEIRPSRVANYWDTRWMTYPIQNNINELPLKDRIFALTSFLAARIKNKKEINNYSDWCQNQYGNYLTKNFYTKFTKKYWRVEMEQLATDWLSGRLIPSQISNIILGAFKSRPEKQAVFTTFRYPAQGGFFNFFKLLYDTHLVQYNQRAREIDLEKKCVNFESGRSESFEVIASSIPLPKLVAMIKQTPSQVREAAKLLRHTQLLCVNILINKPKVTPYHWFYIYDQAIRAARVSVPSNLAPHSVPPNITAIQAEIFYRYNEIIDSEAVCNQTVKDMAKILKFDSKADVISATSVHVPYAYVISDHNRKKAVEHITAWLKNNNIYTMGLYGNWKYMWSDAAFRSGEQTADMIKNYLKKS